jgi:hypothetical protein
MIDTVIVGAGPYGLSIAAHFRGQGLGFRIFGPPMENWLAHMPKGMMLKSDGFASNLYDPENSFTLRQFCTERSIEYSDTKIPVSLETFSAYGLAFKERFVPELENKLVVGVEQTSQGFLVRLEDGEQVRCRQVVLAVGISHYEYVPSIFANLPSELFSHSFRHHNLDPFRGSRVAVVGGGASAIGLAGLLRSEGAEVELIVREKSIKFHSAPNGKKRSLWQQIRHPNSGLGPGLRSRFFSDAPLAFHYLPEKLRLEVVRRSLGPSGHWVSRESVLGHIPLFLGYSTESTKIVSGRVQLNLRGADGTHRETTVDHVIAGTGYRVDIERLKFLSPELRAQIGVVEGSPLLSANFESSVPGLYFVGLSAANSFGPVMRFAFGAGFAARSLTRAVTKSIASAKVLACNVGVVPVKQEKPSVL